MTAAVRSRPAAAAIPAVAISAAAPPSSAAWVWTYFAERGDEWDSQPACWITDYVLAVQCFVTALFISTNEWTRLFVLAMGASATLGGILHHAAFKAQARFPSSSAAVRRVFGLHMTQPTVDRVIRWLWRGVLGLSTLANFSLVARATSRLWHDHVSTHTLTMTVAGVGYSGMVLAAFVSMQTSIMLLGFLPALCLGGVAALVTHESAMELVPLLLLLASGLVQGLQVSPSRRHFNHNALAHVLVGVSIATMPLILT
ncbi:Aste57867_17259 [Aphanomyces stellatus]|uniref:Aste57867_17259 protein n=1 Tax=Aphanomyces stellatus TaxID=120398 RepID=A0A485L854_9STRA|nr:hypothetical protein As57867_017200 [Aphanomyces stellatus]VFT94015.1 Aste57867_17259 [Aphanomyces stellatus]